MPVLDVCDLEKAYTAPTGEHLPILAIPRFSVEAGEQLALSGGSGSGKTTFLHLLAGILSPDAGRITILGTDIASLSETRRDRFRGRHVGYIYQSFNLLQGMTALENVCLGMFFGAGVDRQRAGDLLARVGLSKRLHYRPGQLSVGQQQRVAVARAVASRPALVLADEPTGSLDATHAADTLALIREVCREVGAALLLVSHDTNILTSFDRREALDKLNRVALPTGLAGPSATASTTLEVAP